MFGLSETLAVMIDHLPAGFNSEAGIKSLFPAGYRGSISILNRYVYLKIGKATSSDTNDWANYCIGADGSGRWFFSWLAFPNDIGRDPNIRVQVGFVFLFSGDGFCRGYIDNSNRGILGPTYNPQSCNSGTDRWISDNWPQVFASGPYVGYQEASGFKEVPPESNIWGRAGFASGKFIVLSGGGTPCVGSDSGTGSSLFTPVTYTVDQYVAAIIGAAVAQAMKNNSPISVGVDTVKQAILSPNYPKSVSDAITAYLATPAFPVTVSNAQIVAIQTVKMLKALKTTTGTSIQTVTLTGDGTPEPKATPDITPGQVAATTTAAASTYEGTDGVESEVWVSIALSIAVSAFIGGVLEGATVLAETSATAVESIAADVDIISEWVADSFISVPSTAVPYPGPEPGDAGTPAGAPDPDGGAPDPDGGAPDPDGGAPDPDGGVPDPGVP